ncbi:MAG TPA: stealth family protein [Jatrophihabitantaceae bacterium]|jgi:hypothetical protein|nr:stealth family protein [Jatrophihabitantaceae bacterium]
MGAPQRLAALLPEPAIRAVQRMRHRENPMGGRLRPPPPPAAALVVDSFDAHVTRRVIAATCMGALAVAGVAYARTPAPRNHTYRLVVARADRRRTMAALLELGGPGWQIQSPRGGNLRVTRRIYASTGAELAADDIGCVVSFCPAPTAVPSATALPSAFEVREPVDLVYTWVDGADSAWQARRAAHTADHAQLHATATNWSRFHSRDELRYSLRSVAMYASWVRHIHIVTDSQVPSWLNTAHPKISVVDHRDIFDDPSVLPAFNSHAIESQLHHIPDLAEQYIYMNDDVFFGRLVEPELFFHGNGIAKFFLSTEPIRPGRITSDDLPAMAAAKRQRDLLAEDFGVAVTQKFEHGAHPQLRSVLEDLQKQRADDFDRIARSRFRHPDDLSIASSLHHYYAYLTGRAVPGQMDFRYQDIGQACTPRRLDAIRRDRPQVFCLNDVDSPAAQLDSQQATLRAFLERYFPLPSPFEHTQ